jgi:hypothetical protein
MTTKNKIISKLSDIIKYLKDAGFADAASKVSECVDMLNDGDKCGDGPVSHTYGPAGPGLFSIDQATVVASLIHLANRLDENGLYKEADQLDTILAEDIELMKKVVKKLDKARGKQKRKRKKKKVDSVAAINGKSPDAGGQRMFQGLVDVFYTGYGNLGPQYKS